VPDAPHPTGVPTPARAVYRPGRQAGWVVAAIVGVLLLLGFTLIRGGAHWLASSWVPWVLIVAPLVLLGGTALGTVVSAGDGWLHVRELWYRRWVDLTALTEVDVRPNGPKLRIRLRDRHGRKLVTGLDNLRAEPAVWELVRAAAAVRLADPECRRNPRAEQVFAN
jgi:hypothetical protein